MNDVYASLKNENVFFVAFANIRYEKMFKIH